MSCRALAAPATIADVTRSDKRTWQKSQRLSSSYSGELALRCGAQVFQAVSSDRNGKEPHDGNMKIAGRFASADAADGSVE